MRERREAVSSKEGGCSFVSSSFALFDDETSGDSSAVASALMSLVLSFARLASLASSAFFSSSVGVGGDSIAATALSDGALGSDSIVLFAENFLIIIPTYGPILMLYLTCLAT